MGREIKKWCFLGAADQRLNQLCTEWETNKEKYLMEIQGHYHSDSDPLRRILQVLPPHEMAA